MKILIGSDHLGFGLKEELKAHLFELGHHVVDVGCHESDVPVDYPDVAELLADRIAAGEAGRGILICGTGIGMAIAANKVPGVRAAVCHDPYSAERARASNDAQVLAFGAQIIGPQVAKRLLDVWLASEFQAGRSARKVQKIQQLDQKHRS